MGAPELGLTLHIGTNDFAFYFFGLDGGSGRPDLLYTSPNIPEGFYLSTGVSVSFTQRALGVLALGAARRRRRGG